MKIGHILLLVGGVAALYFFIPRQRAAADGGVSIIPGPTEIVEVPGPIQFIERLIPGPTEFVQVPGATEIVEVPGPIQFIERLIPGATEFIEVPGATQFIPQGIMPELNIPEFEWPVFDVPDWGQYIPDWKKLIPDFDFEKYIPDIPDELKIDIVIDVPDLIPSVDGLGFGEVGQAGTSLIQATTGNLTDYLTNFEKGANWFYEAIFQGGLLRFDAENSLAQLFPSLTPKPEGDIEFSLYDVVPEYDPFTFDVAEYLATKPTETNTEAEVSASYPETREYDPRVAVFAEVLEEYSAPSGAV